MNLPNKLTCLRILLMPFTFYLVFLNHALTFLFGYILATIIGFTDYFDGLIARRYGIVTRFGKFLDPLADKIFVVTMFFYLFSVDYVPAWFMILIVVREFSMTDLRILAVQEKTDIRVNLLGKRKALFQYALLFHLGYLRFMELSGNPLTGFEKDFAFGTKILLIVLVSFFTAFSMFYYLWINGKSLFKEKN